MKAKEQIQNEIKIKLPSLSVNEWVARSAVAAFVLLCLSFKHLH